MPFAAVASIAVLTLACGSRVVTVPPITAPPSATTMPASPATPATSPTPVPGSSAGPEDGVFRTQHSVPGGGVALQIVLQDLTGLVTGIGPLATAISPFDEGVANPDGQPNTLNYTWVGGSCDTLTLITFERGAGGFRLTATTKTTGGTCDLVGIFRGIAIAFSEPIEAGGVVVGDP